MKNITKSFIALFALLALSCNTDDVQDRPVVQGIDAPVLEAPETGNVYTLNPDTMDQLAERFVWSAANLGTGIIPNYAIQIGAQGQNFATPATVGITSGTLQFAASHSILNAALLTLGATPYETASFEVRIKAYVGDVVMYSNAVEMIITPYTTETPRLWIPGGYQAESGYGANFSYETAPQLKSLAYGNFEFEGYMYIANTITSPDNGFKFATQPNENGTNYGSTASDGVLSATAGNITATAGYYLVKANPSLLTYSLTPANWGIIGNSTPGGWENSTPMTYDAATKKWTLTVALTAQNAPDNGWKFRANNAWDLNLGDTVANASDGTLVYSGANIGVATAGTYVITLDLSNPRAYTYTITLQ